MRQRDKPERTLAYGRKKTAEAGPVLPVMSALRSFFRRQYFLHTDIINEVFPSDVGQVRPLLRVHQTSANPTRHREDKGLITHIEPIATSDKFAIGIPGKRIVGVCSEVGLVKLGHSKHAPSLDWKSASRRGAA